MPHLCNDCKTRGFTSAHQRDLSIARDLQAQMGYKPVSQRSSVVNRAASTDEARFREWLARPEASIAFSARAAGEGTGSAGGYAVPQRLNADLIHALREYDGLLSAFELWNSPDGEVTNRPVYSQFSPAVAQVENASFTDGPMPSLNQQAWGLAPTYAASFTPSFQLVQDAFNYPNVTSGDSMGIERSDPFANRTLDQWVAAMLGESVGRVIAPAAQTALMAGITTVGATSGGAGGYLGLTAGTAVTFANGATTELAANTINLDTAAQMLEALDSAYLASPNCAWYMSPQNWAGLLRQVDAQKKALMDPGHGKRVLYDIPVAGVAATQQGIVGGCVAVYAFPIALTDHAVQHGQRVMLCHAHLLDLCRSGLLTLKVCPVG
jgi:hypothetical protein